MAGKKALLAVTLAALVVAALEFGDENPDAASINQTTINQPASFSRPPSVTTKTAPFARSIPAPAVEHLRPTRAERIVHALARDLRLSPEEVRWRLRLQDNFIDLNENLRAAYPAYIAESRIDWENERLVVTVTDETVAESVRHAGAEAKVIGPGALERLEAAANMVRTLNPPRGSSWGADIENNTLVLGLPIDPPDQATRAFIARVEALGVKVETEVLGATTTASQFSTGLPPPQLPTPDPTDTSLEGLNKLLREISSELAAQKPIPKFGTNPLPLPPASPLLIVTGGSRYTSTLAAGATGNCRIGFNALRPSEPGIAFSVTAGHCARDGGSAVFFPFNSSRRAGRINSEDRFYPGDDFAAIRYDEFIGNVLRFQLGFEVFNPTNEFNFIAPQPLDPMPGTMVCLALTPEAGSAGYNCGVTLGIRSQTLDQRGQIVEGLIESTVCGVEGDSGGPLVRQPEGAETIQGVGIFSIFTQAVVIDGKTTTVKCGDPKYRSFHQPLSEALSRLRLVLPNTAPPNPFAIVP